MVQKWELAAVTNEWTDKTQGKTLPVHTSGHATNTL